MATDAGVETTGFDYSEFGPHAKQVEHCVNFIKRQERKTIEGIVLIGDALITIGDSCKHGQYGRLIATHFPRWSRDTSARYVRIAQAHKQNPQIAEIGISALHELLAPGVAPQAVQEALAIEESGANVTVAAAREIAAQHKPAKPKPVHPEPPQPDEADEGDDEQEEEAETDEAAPESDEPAINSETDRVQALRSVRDELCETFPSSPKRFKAVSDLDTAIASIRELEGR